MLVVLQSDTFVGFSIPPLVGQHPDRCTVEESEANAHLAQSTGTAGHLPVVGRGQTEYTVLKCRDPHSSFQNHTFSQKRNYMVLPQT